MSQTITEEPSTTAVTTATTPTTTTARNMKRTLPLNFYLGIEKLVRFANNQQAGEENARRYVMAIQDLEDLNQAIQTAGPEDNRVPAWMTVAEERKGELNQIQKFPLTREFISLVQNRQEQGARFVLDEFCTINLPRSSRP